MESVNVGAGLGRPPDGPTCGARLVRLDVEASLARLDILPMTKIDEHPDFGAPGTCESAESQSRQGARRRIPQSKS